LITITSNTISRISTTITTSSFHITYLVIIKTSCININITIKININKKKEGKKKKENKRKKKEGKKKKEKERRKTKEDRKRRKRNKLILDGSLSRYL
jgi:hypothetical protein